jgi:HD-GYP domain-containing protein (c-di-GMP phosphodiesterase class II)
MDSVNGDDGRRDDLTRALLVALGERDRHTLEHSDRVVAAAVALGRHCGLSSGELNSLWLAAAFHDIGKIGIPDQVLLKPGSLDGEEWTCMKTHTAVGERILRALPVPGVEAAAAAVRHHHEHYDGAGYPDGLGGEDIPVLSRIISVVDSYDAMATTRSYHRGRDHGQVMATLRRETGSKHDPYVVARFEQWLAENPFPADC